MNYQKIYERIIDRAKNRELTCYKERHHILPRCLGGTDENSNLVDLTPEEHYVCHQLLVKIHPGNKKVLYAVQAMTMCGLPGKKNKIYGWLKRKLSQIRTKDKFALSCKFCRSSFLVHECNTHRVYCSRACKSKDNRITKTCPVCAKVFSKMKSKETIYCSFKCAKINLKPPSQKGREYGERTIKTCPTCSKEFIRLKCLKLRDYCSRSCKLQQTERLTHKCQNCAKEFTDYKAKGLRKFCSSACKYSFGVSLEARAKMSKVRKGKQKSPRVT